MKRRHSKILVQGPGAVTTESAIRAAAILENALAHYGPKSGLGHEAVSVSSRLVEQVSAKILQKVPLNSEMLLSLTTKQLFHPLEDVLFRSGHVTSQTVHYASKLAKRAATFLTLVSRHDLTDRRFHFENRIAINLDQVDSEDWARDLVIYSQVAEVEFATPNGHWIRLGGVPVRKICYDSREFAVFALTRGQDGPGLETFRYAVMTPIHLRPSVDVIN